VRNKKSARDGEQVRWKEEIALQKRYGVSAWNTKST